MAVSSQTVSPQEEPFIADVRHARRLSREDWRDRIQNDWREFQAAPEWVRADRTIVLAAVSQSGGALRFAVETLREDREIVMAAVRECPKALEFASGDALEDRGIVLEAVRRCGDVLWMASEVMQSDREIVRHAVQQDGLALAYASELLRADRELVLIAVSQNGASLAYADADLRSDRDLVLAAVRRDGDAMCFASQQLRGDHAFVRAAVWRNADSLSWACGSVQEDRELSFMAARSRQKPVADSTAASPSEDGGAGFEPASGGSTLADQRQLQSQTPQSPSITQRHGIKSGRWGPHASSSLSDQDLFHMLLNSTARSSDKSARAGKFAGLCA